MKKAVADLEHLVEYQGYWQGLKQRAQLLERHL